MNGGPSHVDTFDPKPMLDQARRRGAARRRSRRPAQERRQADAVAVQVREARPERHRGQRAVPRGRRACIDDLCVIRSMYTDIPNHEPALLMMNSGKMQPTRPSLGSWLTYGLGTENQNLPGFVVLCPGKPVVGPQLWSNSFLPGIYQGTHINNKTVDPEAIIRDVDNRHLARGRPARAARPAPADEPSSTSSRAAGDDPARGPDRVAGDGLPHAVRGPARPSTSASETAADARRCTARASSPTPA